MATEEKLLYPKLRGSVNYQVWRSNLEAAFAAEDAVDIVNGEEPCPPRPEIKPNLSKDRFAAQLPLNRNHQCFIDEQIASQYNNYKEE